MTDAKGKLAHGLTKAVMSLACQHLHLTTFLPPDCRLWMWQKDATHPVPHIPCLNASVHHLFFFFSLPLPFVLFGVFVMDISRPPPDPFKTFLGELSPFSWGPQQPPWGLNYQRRFSLHITQLTRQQPKPGSLHGGEAAMNQPTSHILDGSSTVVSQSWKPHCHHFKFSQMTVDFKRLQQAMEAWLMTSHYTTLHNHFLPSALLPVNFKLYYNDNSVKRKKGWKPCDSLFCL